MAKRNETDKNYALKTITKYEGFEDEKINFENEVQIMEQLDHPNIVSLWEYSSDGILRDQNGTETQVFYLVLEFCEYGELFDLIAESGAASESLARYYFHQLISGLEHLHSKGIGHRDIKLENLLIDSQYNLKIADFGFSTRQARNESFKGTQNYMSPEIFSGGEYNSQSADLFASGIILFWMIAQHPPFEWARKENPHYNLIRVNNHEGFWRVHSRSKPEGFFSEDFKSLINSMLALK